MAEKQETYDGVERRHNSSASEQFVVVKSWHTVLILITLIAGIILSYGSVRDQTDENTRRIRDLEQRPQVSQQSVDELNRRLERLEQRFDTQDLREYQRLGEPARKRP
jgi:hypothetical protein